MNLDLRMPIGLIFTIFGVMLTLYGLVSDATIYERSLGVNVNLWWGMVLLVFGLVMLAFAVRALRQRHRETRTTDSTSTP